MADGGGLGKDRESRKETIFHIREERIAWSEQEETKKIIEMLQSGSNLKAVEESRIQKGKKRQGQGELEFSISSLKGPICREAFEAIYGFNHSRVQRAIDKSKAVVMGDVKGYAAKMVSSSEPRSLTVMEEKKRAAFAFLKYLVEKHSSVNPIDAKFHECLWTREDFYCEYQKEWEVRKKKPLKRSSFYVLWENKMKAIVKILGQSPCNKTCEVCINLNSCISLSSKLPDWNELFKAYRKIHKKSEEMEVALYYERIEHSIQHPDKAISIASDGAAQWRHNIPNLATSDAYSGVKLSQHLTVVIIHGKKVFIFRNLEHIPNNANLVIHCINFALNWALEHGMSLPETLYWQSDGGSENANNGILAYFALLVKKKVFKRVIISRCPVGSTKNDVDRAIGHGNKGLKSGGSHVVDPEEFKRRFLRGLQDQEEYPEPEFVEVFAVYDVWSWLVPLMSKFERLFKLGHTQHQIKLEYSKTDKAVVLYHKKYASSKLRIVVPKSGWDEFLKCAGQDSLITVVQCDEQMTVRGGDHQKGDHGDGLNKEPKAGLVQESKRKHRLERPSGLGNGHQSPDRRSTEVLTTASNRNARENLKASDYVVATVHSKFMPAGPVFKTKVEGMPALQPYKDISKILDQVRRGIEENHLQGIMISESSKRSFDNFLDEAPSTEEQYKELGHTKPFRIPGSSKGHADFLLCRKPNDPVDERMRDLETSEFSDIVLRQRPTVRRHGMSSSELKALSEWASSIGVVPAAEAERKVGRRRMPKLHDVVVVRIERADANNVPFRFALVRKVMPPIAPGEVETFRIQFYGQQCNGIALPYTLEVGQRWTRFHLFILPSGDRDECTISYDNIADTLDKQLHYMVRNHHALLDLRPAGREVVFANPLFKGHWDIAIGKYRRAKVLSVEEEERYV